MEWSDNGIVIGVRRHGENNVILELMTAAHGRHLGLVRGGRSRRQQATLQPGNSVHATWRARLDAHLGAYSVEPVVARAARLMESALGIHVAQTLGGLLRLLPERDPHERLYLMTEAILDHLGDDRLIGELLVRFEATLLEELGFGLDLTSCAATGACDDLVWVSPKSARAVSRSAGEPYRDRLLALPRFLVEGHGDDRPGFAEIADGFKLTGFFLARHIYEPRGLAPLRERERVIELVTGS